MFFQVLFEKTCSMKFAKRLEDRWIFASSGTVSFWQPESPSPGGRMFFQVLFEKTCSMKFSKRFGERRKEKGKEMEKNGKQKEMKEEKGRENAQPVQA